MIIGLTNNMKNLIGILSFALVLSINPIIIKDANAVYNPAFTPCSETDYKKPCSCEGESSWIKKRICNFRAGIKKEDYVKLCADRSHGYADTIAKKVYKDCMHDHGF